MDNQVTDTTTLREIYRQPSKLVASKNVAGYRCRIGSLSGEVAAVRAGDSRPRRDRRIAPRRAGWVRFARVLDDGARLAFGDLNGNNRLDSYTNFLDNPQVGLIFFVPGSDHTIRVNGTASLTTDPDICAAATVGDRVPKTAVVVDVDECFLHCGKALLRANIWDTSTWPEDNVPTGGEILAAQHELQVEPEDIDRNLEAGYSATLWADAGS